MAHRQNPYARPDARTRAAKAQGFPARSVFKLEEVDAKARLLRPGQRVLDLGAAPGSWSLFAAQRVGASGRVVGIDLQAIEVAAPPNVTFLQGDAFEPNAELAARGPYDVVLSDMAPRTTGSKALDQAGSYRLFCRAVEVAGQLGRPGAHFVGKLFMSEEFAAARELVRTRFAECRVVRPKATRVVSSEVFLVGIGLRGSTGT